MGEHPAGAMADIPEIPEEFLPPKGAEKLSEVFAWGEASEGQLGLGKSVLDDGKVNSPAAVEALNGVYVTHIANGNEHTLFATSTEEVYSCGSGDKGKLGHSDAEVYGEGCNHKTQNVMNIICPSPRLIQGLAIDKRPAVEGN